MRRFIKLAFPLLLIYLMAGNLFSQDLLISGVIDGPLTGGIPKAVEFFVVNDIADLSQYGFGSANNGGGSDGEEFTFPAVSATAGQFIYCATESTAFQSFFGFAPDYTNGSAPSINGDDAIELFYMGGVIDVFGEIDVDGTGQPWEYTDGWAYRIDDTGPDGSVFALANWNFSGPDALDGETTNATATTPFPTGAFTYQPGQDLLISGVIDGPLTGGLPKAVEFYVVNDIADLSQYGFGSANNGGGSDGEEFTFPPVSAVAGQFIYCSNDNATGFQDFFGFDPDYSNVFAASINGDDAIELFFQGSVIDVFGDINLDGTGTPWEYMDGWAYRVNGTGPDGDVFALANWTFSGPNALDGETTNATASIPFPLGTYGNATPPLQSIDEPFDSGLGVFTAYSVTGAQEWGTAFYGNPPPCASMTGFAGAPYENEDWLISPSLDLSEATGIELSFDEAANYEPNVSGNCQVLMSSDYTGSGDPNAATWTVITMPGRVGGNSWTFLNTGTATTNDFDGLPSVFLAFRYTSTASAAGTWELDNIHLAPVEIATLTYIHDIQGSGETSPMNGEVVMIEAVVVADFQDTNINGFFVQEEDADADGDPATSEGIFIYSTIPVSIGDLVQVSGTVNEYYSLTELNNVTGVVIIASGTTLPTPAIVELPVADAIYLERFEGMSVHCPQTLTVNETYYLGRYGEVTLSNGRRYIPTNVVDPGPDAIAMQAQNDLNAILLDDGNTWQNVDPIVFGRNGNPLTADNTLRCGDQVTGLNGVLTYSFSGSPGTDAYRIHATETVYFTDANPRTDVPADVGGRIKVSAFNVLNYFNGDGMGGGFPTSRGADDLVEFNRQRDKIIAAIDKLNVDIIGLMEIENDGYGPYSAIQDLVNGLNAFTSGNSYAFIDPGVGAIGTDEIAVGIIYRPETVTPLGTSQILDNTVDPTFNSDANRPCLAQSFAEIETGGVVTVAVNHLKSKGSECPGDPDTGDGQGNCNLTRTAAAVAIVNWLDTDPTGSGEDNYLIIGDLNSYAKEDPITAIRNGGYTDLIDLFGTNAYSYVFYGQAGYLDHALASAHLLPYVTGTAIWHINADEPGVLDYNMEYKSTNQHVILYNPDQYRASDHDPVIVGINLPQSVGLDMKPGSWPNPVNTKSNGVTPAAILGTEEFDVYTIDVGSLYLDLPEGMVAPVSFGYEDVSGPAGTAWECNDTEEGGDGYTDLTLKFLTQELVAALGEVNDGDELVITLKGSVTDGPDLEGDDCILILQKGKEKSTETGTSSFSLAQNYPNPCNSVTKIPFEIPEDSHVTLKVFDVLGNEVAVLVNKHLASGTHVVEFDAGKLAGGIYIYTIRTADHTAARHMLVNE